MFGSGLPMLGPEGWDQVGSCVTAAGSIKRFLDRYPFK